MKQDTKKERKILETKACSLRRFLVTLYQANGKEREGAARDQPPRPAQQHREQLSAVASLTDDADQLLESR